MEKLHISGIVPMVEEIAIFETTEVKVSKRNGPFSIQPSKSMIDKTDISDWKISTNGGSIRGRIWSDTVGGRR